MVQLGTFILAFGWFGFNAGSSLAGSDGRIGIVAANTMIASMSATVAGILYMWARYGKPDPGAFALVTLESRGSMVARESSGHTCKMQQQTKPQDATPWNGLGLVVMGAAAARTAPYLAAFDHQDLAVNKCVGDLPTCGLDDATERRARHLHAGGCLLLVEPLKIRESERFELVQGHDNLIEGVNWNSRGSEYRRGGLAGDLAAAGRSGHE